MYDKDFLAGHGDTRPESSQVSLHEDDERNITWETNHQKIISAISKSLRAYMVSPPTVTDISKMTGLSRKTVYMHLNEYSDNPVYAKRTEMFGAMKFDVMMRMCSAALAGDIKAARLYLELTGSLKPENKINNNFISNSSNIQVNGITLNQQVLQNLSPGQLKQIEEIIRPITNAEQG